MKTMGIGRLCLAGSSSYDEGRVAVLAVHAMDVYQRAERHPDLKSALLGTGLSAGFTRRRGERRKSFSISVDDFAKMAHGQEASGDIALVFGNERSGLSRQELDLCSIAVHIPTSGDFPSLNLAQAVQIATWELRRQTPTHLSGSYLRAARDDVVSTIDRAALRLRDLGFFKLNQGDELREFLRDLAERAALSSSELRYFEAFIHKMAGLSSRADPCGAGGVGAVT
jgi:tRNA/rRNA methyltransferase